MLDTTIVNVALPSIKTGRLHHQPRWYGWSNAYMLTLAAACCWAGGWAICSRRRLFLAGITLFTVASLVCGLANTQGCWWRRVRCRAWAARW